MSVKGAVVILIMLVTVIIIGFRVGVPQAAFALITATPTTQTGTASPSVEEAVSGSVRARGALAEAQSSRITFSTAGQITALLVNEGDPVAQGDPLAVLDSRDVLLAYEQANLNYEAALRAWYDVQTVDEDALRIAEANLAAARSAYTAVASAVSPEDSAAAELQYQQAQEALDAANVARANAPGNLSTEAYSLLDARVGEASFNVEIARLQIEELRTAPYGELGAAGAQITQAQAELDRVRAGANQFEIASAQVAVDQAAAALDALELTYDQHVLHAPFAGIVAAVYAEVGQRVAPSAAILQLIDLTPLLMNAELDEIDVPRVALGQPVEITVDALPGVTFPGTVTQINPAGRNLNGLTVYDVQITLVSADSRLRPGMNAAVEIAVES